MLVMERIRFPGYYLEDSYVLGVRQTNGDFIFDMELALRETNPEWKRPRGSETRCYRRGRLVFPEATEVTWNDIDVTPNVRPDGTVHFGRVNSIQEAADGERYQY
jgi:hypothetical protein